jgi:non-specific serine/threonine protein kinase
VFQGTSLTAREREVVVLVANGLTNRQIANRLNITEWTATNHVRHVMRKLGLRSRVHVAQWVTQRYLSQ